MKAIEFKSHLNTDETLSVPPNIVPLLPKEESIRVLVLMEDSEDDADWSRFTAMEFLKGYGESDAIYDDLPGG
jgi:hypothetical protein